MTGRRRAIDPIASRVFALRTVARIGARRRELEVELRDALLSAYAAGGVTWGQLGAALGVTGSVAWHLAHPDGPPVHAITAGADTH